MKPRWKWLIGILTGISFATLILLTTLNHRWEPDFLQTLKAVRTEQSTYYFDNGSWITTRNYQIPANYADVVKRMKGELVGRDWQWSKTTVQYLSAPGKPTYLGWHINGPPHSFQIEDKPKDRTNPTARLVWQETPGNMEVHWIRFKIWLGFTPNPRKK